MNNNCDYQRIVAGSILTPNEFKELEREECQNIKLTAIQDFNICLTICYCSAQRQNRYYNSYHFSFHDIDGYLKKYNQIQKNKQSVSYQRQLMTPKLRYKILLRDGLKCVICGRSRKDGAILHVDHIKPVSKGGKTEESNLRTLCDRCNLGKGASYDPNGLN